MADAILVHDGAILLDAITDEVVYDDDVTESNCCCGGECEVCRDGACASLATDPSYEVEISGSPIALFNGVFEVQSGVATTVCNTEGCEFGIEFVDGISTVKIGFNIRCLGDPCCTALFGYARFDTNVGGSGAIGWYFADDGTFCAAPLLNITNLNDALPIDLVYRRANPLCVSSGAKSTGSTFTIRQVV